MKIYIQTDEVSRITDAITYPHDGYTEVETISPLPTGLLGGAYELRDGMILYRREWDVNEDMEMLKAQNEAAMQAIVELSLFLTGGM